MMHAALLTAVALLGLWGTRPPPPGDVRIEGNDSFSTPQLLAILRNRYYVSLTGDFEVTDADDAAYFLRTFYFSRGFREAKVKYTFRSSRPPSALFLVNEGPRKLIGSVVFEGESILLPDRLREIFDARVRQATLSPFGRMRYVASAVESGRQAIVTALSQRGFLMATADVSEPEPPVNNMVGLRLRIYQGVRYFVRDVSFVGAPIDDETLRGVLNEYLEQPYQRSQEALMRTRVKGWFRDHGYLQAHVQISTTMNAGTGDVSAVFDIDAGRTYTIGKIRIEGAEATKESAILSRF
jgi:outer membrane protein assembly factor BamA